MTDLILFGPPGAGKSSVAGMLVERDGYVSLSTGNILRDEMARGTPLGLEIDPVKMASGQFSDDGLVNRVVLERVRATPPEQPLIFDGHPRNPFQFGFFESMMVGLRRSVIAVRLQAGEDILLSRIMARSLIEARADDRADVFRERIRLYETQTAPVYELMSGVYPTYSIDTSYVGYEHVYEVVRKYLRG